MHGKIRRFAISGAPRLLLFLSLTLPLTPACNQSSDDPPTTQTSAEERLAQLRSIPYTGGMPAPKTAPTGVTQLSPKSDASGLRLYTVPMLGRAELIRHDGDVVQSWQQPGDRWERAELTPDGSLMVVGLANMGWADGTEPAGVIPDSVRYLAKFDWSGEQVWRVPMLAHHDVEVTPAGHVLALAFERRLIPDVHASVEVRDDQLVLLDADGMLIEARSFYDGAVASRAAFPLQAVQPSVRSDREWVDLFHSNSVEWMSRPELEARAQLYSADYILVSLRHQDCIAIYDWRSAQFVWSWGQGVLRGPHDASLLASGNILVFDNGLGRDWSRAVELDPVSDEVVWTYEAAPRESFFTASRGSAQRLPNGNTLLAESDRGRAIEVTTRGEIVWEFICPRSLGPEKRAAIGRMTFYPFEFLESRFYGGE